MGLDLSNEGYKTRVSGMLKFYSLKAVHHRRKERREKLTSHKKASESEVSQ